MSEYIKVFPRVMRFPNYLMCPVHDGDDLKFSVGELSEAEAEKLWDSWKAAWLEHVSNRRSAKGAPHE